MGVVSMLQRAPLVTALFASLLLASIPSASGQNRNSDQSTTPAGTTSTPAPRTQSGSTGTAPTGTKPTGNTGTRGNPSRGNTAGNSGSRSGGGRTTTPGRTGSSGGNGGAVAVGAIGAAVAGVALFEHLHHAHVQDEGQTVQRLSLTLRYPSDWKLNPRLNLQDDPISFNNFNNSYLQGGIIPPGGADIDVALFTGAKRPVSELIAAELPDADQKTIDSHIYKVDGQKGTRVFYTDIYAPNFAYTNVVVYLPHGTELYKFFLTYHQGDSNEKNFNDDFEYILKSVRFQR
jgi:hypothetical protein